ILDWRVLVVIFGYDINTTKPSILNNFLRFSTRLLFQKVFIIYNIEVKKGRCSLEKPEGEKYGKKYV
ncbi:MAG: hypothetical protein RXP98_06315, partial [Thermoplasmata archaeon]